MTFLRLPGPLAARRPRNGRAAEPHSRLGWLDALRGIAALAVVMQHFDILRLVSWGGEVWLRYDFGLYGVMLFFIVSGYIIPASLERRGDVRAFWIGRIFRIHPALVTTIVAFAVLLPADRMPVTVFQPGHIKIKILANATMLQELLNTGNGLRVMWTLSYEMVFYFFVSALFVQGWHRRSSPIAVGFSAVALLLGGGAFFTTQGLTQDLPSVIHMVLASTFVVVAALVFMLTGKQQLIRTGALMLGGLGLILITLNSRAPAFETFMIFATMFAGTVVYRAEHGQIERMEAWLSCGFVMACGFLVGYLYNKGPGADATWTAGWISWCTSYLGAWASFGLFMLLRNRRFPRVLTWLGAVSFSMYLLHVPVLYALVGPFQRPTFSSPASQKIEWTLGYMAVLLVLCALMYYLVELPMQKAGRKIVKALGRRASDRAGGARVPTPAAGEQQELVSAGSGSAR